MIIPVNHSAGQYNIYLEKGAIKKVAWLLRLDRKVIVVTDDGVPSEYAAGVAAAAKQGVVITIPQGEASEKLDTFKFLLEKLVENNVTRTDCIVAVGGGVVGDLAGFVASVYMRGIDFYNIPTTVLSQVDSSIGGKTAIDFCGIKNIVGAFYPPKAVIIDPDTLKTLPQRQISNGLAEVVKMSLTSDAELFAMFENGYTNYDIEEIIHRALLIKKDVVQQDEKESGLRRILNFGHTIAHAVESAFQMDKYYHGECVAIGIVPMCSEAVRERLIPVLRSLDLPTEIKGDPKRLSEAIAHDKKATGSNINIVCVDKIGEFKIKTVSIEELQKRIERGEAL